ncbi:MAG: AAA family ATPase [Caldilineaceae bacterium]|nr:AAA family ATPase [Caldilineaceae bacterium]
MLLNQNPAHGNGRDSGNQPAVQGRTCPGCGQSTPHEGQFCIHCGTRLAPAPPAPRLANPPLDLQTLVPAALAHKMRAAAADIRGERREVTVVFLDVNGFTASARSMDSEDVYLVVDEAMRLLVEVVYKYEGTVDKFTGDGLMALFGAPIGHENDPERAVRAALEMQAALCSFRKHANERYGFDFQARIGVNTGPVVAGKLGNDLHLEYTVIGDTVNLASRLEHAAQPGTTLVSFETYQRTRPIFHYELHPPLQVKGIDELILAAQPSAVKTKPERVRGIPGLRVPMVGRADGLEQLLSALDDVERTGRARIALVSGDAGIGKSRLVAEFRSRVDNDRVRSFEGQCLNYARKQPYRVVADLLRNLYGMSEADPPAQQWNVLRAQTMEQGALDSDALPYLAHVLGLDPGESDQRPIIEQFDSAMLQRQTHIVLHRALRAEAEKGPVIFVFEDLHWIDSASRDFLIYLLQNVDELPLLIVLVSRGLERETVVAPLIVAAKRSPSRLLDIQLQLLARPEVEELVGKLIPADDKETAHIKQKIVERSEGNPLYVEEMVRMLVDRNGLIGEPGSWKVTRAAEQIITMVPGTVKGLVLARFDRRPDPLRRILQNAAVIGRSFPRRLLHALYDVTPESLDAGLMELVDDHFLVQRANVDGDWFEFQHVLIQEAIYSTLLRRDRREIHGLVGEAIENDDSWPVDDKAELVAHHFSRSTSPARAIPYLRTVAEKAAASSANWSAIAHFRQLLELDATHGELDAGESAQIQIGLARVLKFVGEYDDAEQTLRQAIDQIRALRAEDRGNELLGDQVDGLRELADVYAREGAFELAVNKLHEGLDLLGEDPHIHHSHLWQTLLDRLSWIYFRQGKLAEAVDAARMLVDKGSADERADP